MAGKNWSNPHRSRRKPQYAPREKIRYEYNRECEGDHAIHVPHRVTNREWGLFIQSIERYVQRRINAANASLPHDEGTRSRNELEYWKNIKTFLHQLEWWLTD